MPKAPAVPKKVSKSASAKSAASAVEHLSPPVPAPTSKAGALASSLDSVARVRSLPVPGLTSIPVPPKDYVPLLPEERQRLRKLAADLRAEALAALTELSASSATYQADLGDLVPEVAETGPLAKRMADSAANLAAAQLYASYVQDLQLVAFSDGLELLEAVHAELIHRLPRRPQLATKYAKVLSLFEQRAASISEGMAQARKTATKEDPDPPK
jgi:hypothetical protein